MTACIHGEVCREYLRQRRGIICRTCPRGCRFYEPDDRTCHDVSHFGENFRCSECGVAVTVEYDDSMLYVGELSDDFSYCPNCGAKVVGE